MVLRTLSSIKRTCWWLYHLSCPGTNGMLFVLKSQTFFLSNFRYECWNKTRFYSVHRQCRCVFHNQVGLARLQDQLQLLLACAVDNIITWTESNPASQDDRTESPTDTWSISEKEKLFCAIVKVFQLHFPFYQARKINLLNKVSCSQMPACRCLSLFNWNVRPPYKRQYYVLVFCSA